MPSLSNFSKTVEEYGASKLESILDPQVVNTSFVQKISLWAIGKPSSGKFVLFLYLSSDFFACAIA